MLRSRLVRPNRPARAAAATLVSSIAIALAVTARPAAAEDASPEALEALQALVESMRDHPAVRVKSTLRLSLEQNGQTASGDARTVELLHVRGGDGVLRCNGFTCHVNGDTVYAVHDESDKAYYRETFEDAPYWTFFNAFREIPFPHIALVWGGPELDFLLGELHYATPMLAPTALETLEVDGAATRRLVLSGPNGRLRIDIDPATSLVRAMEHVITGGPFVEPGVVQRTVYEIETEILPEPPAREAYVFDAGTRGRVDVLAALLPQRRLPDGPAPVVGGERGAGRVGQPAPPVILQTADNDAVDLADLEGQVVVLDFWATWCGPCVASLPGLHDVARWAKDEQLPVTILTVNVWEIRNPEQNTPEARLEAVRAFWKRHGHFLPIAMDFSDQVAAAYQLGGIPTTVVIRSDGIVHDHHVGAMTPDALKVVIREAIDALEE